MIGTIISNNTPIPAGEARHSFGLPPNIVVVKVPRQVRGSLNLRVEWDNAESAVEVEAQTVDRPSIEAPPQEEDSISVHIVTDEDLECEILCLLEGLGMSEVEFLQRWAEGTTPDTFEAGLLETLIRYR